MVNLTLTCCLFFAFLLLNTRLKFLSLKPSFLAIFLGLAIFIQILPGLLMVSYFDAPLSFGAQNLISRGVLDYTYFITISSLLILFLCLYVFSFFSNLDFNIYKINTNYRVSVLLTVLSVILIVVKVLSVGDIPLFLAISGDVAEANYVKSLILKNQIGVGGFLIGYIFKYFPIASLIYVLIHYIQNRSKLNESSLKSNHFYRRARLILFFNFSFMVFYSLYDMRKSALVFILFIICAVYMTIGRWKLALALPAIGLAILIVNFMLLHGVSFELVLQKVVNRVFIGQIEGSYFIYEALTPSFDYLYYGMPLVSHLGKLAVDPSAEVISYFFPTAGESWVNSNTYMQAHAWAIFSNLSILIAPLLVSLNILFIALLARIFSTVYGDFAKVVYITIIMTLPINNDFSYFLYFKPVLCFLILSLLYMFWISITSALRLK